MPVRLERPGPHPHVAIVTLDRPEKANALDPGMLCDLAAAWRELAADDAIRAIVLTGAGERVFCSGMDMARTIPAAQALARGERYEVERPFTHGGHERWLRFIAVPTAGDLILTCVDVTDAKRREVAMRAAASEDALTGLLNRRGFEADAETLLAAPLDGSPRRCALLYLDLDRFKRVNDEIGHEAGDLMLCEFAARLQRCTRGPDLVARLGGDEFVVLLPESDEEGALWVAQRLLELSREPVRIGVRAHACTPSIGIALHPRHGDDLKALLHAADRAMYAAKSEGRGVAIAR